MIYYLYLKTQEDLIKITQLFDEFNLEWIHVRPLYNDGGPGVRVFIPIDEPRVLMTLKFEFLKKIRIPNTPN